MSSQKHNKNGCVWRQFVGTCNAPRNLSTLAYFPENKERDNGKG